MDCLLELVDWSLQLDSWQPLEDPIVELVACYSAERVWAVQYCLVGGGSRAVVGVAPVDCPPPDQLAHDDWVGLRRLLLVE